jgi:hypothetical protein
LTKWFPLLPIGQYGGNNRIVPHAMQRIAAMLIAHDEDDVGSFAPDGLLSDRTGIFP